MGFLMWINIKKTLVYNFFKFISFCDEFIIIIIYYNNNFTTICWGVYINKATFLQMMCSHICFLNKTICCSKWIMKSWETNLLPISIERVWGHRNDISLE